MTQYIDFDSNEFETRDFFLTTLEETCRDQLNDSEAKITRSTSEGRILLDVQQDGLGNFFDWLRDQKDINWGQEKDLLQREISGLKAQLDKAHAKRDHSPSRDKSLKSNAQKDLSKKDRIIKDQDFQLKKVGSMLNDAEQHLSEKDSIIKNRDFQLEKVCSMLNNAQKDLSEKDGIIKSQDFQLKKVGSMPNNAKKDRSKKDGIIQNQDYRLKQVGSMLNSAQQDMSEKDGIIKSQDFELNKVRSMLNNAQKDLSEKDGIIKSQDFELKKFCSMLNNAKKYLSEKDGIIKNQYLQSKKMKGENEALRKDLEEEKSVLLAERKMLALAKTNMEWEMEFLLETERKELQGQLSKTKEDLQKTKDEAKTHQAQLNEQRAKTEKLTADLKKSDKFMSNCLPEMEELRVDKSKIMAALKYAEEELKSVHHMWQEDKSSHLAELEKSHDSHLVQLEMQDKVHKTIMADLKTKFEDQLASDRLLWQQEKTSLLEETEKTSFSFVAQLQEQRQSNDTLGDALEKAAQQIQSHRIECHDLSLLQAKAAESVQQTLQEEEYEWTTDESSQLDDLENLIGKTKKRTKWYRKLF
ncbi:myosin-9-like isoform X1 [Sebastes umbrosus]|uniref:myosin-9-like isoform X1 n=1 Tax=Sebastes umbrosus TaxID=72105 RepID=UPI00189EA1EA|nr:myosin-9-like isoform X1 [Sebastes umbrosus]